MVIIVEGLDGVGKTTICKQLCQQLPLTYVKESYVGDNKQKRIRMRLMLSRVLDQNETFLYDRTTLIDDYVYSFLNKSQSCLLEYQDVALALLAHCQIFHLRLDEKIRKARFDQRGDEYITNDMIDNIVASYSNFYQQLDNVQFVDLSGDIDKDVRKLVRRINDDRNITHSI